MAGIAAYFGSVPAVLDDLTRALAPRGGDPNAWHSAPGQPALGLGLRAAVPEIKVLAGTAIVLDGIAEATTLLGRYAAHGPRALLLGTDPYAMALADPARGVLVLARNGDGAPLYYAVLPDTVLVASEPGALLAAGVPSTPDPATVARFLATGACDDTEATFHTAIRRVLPGQVITVTRDGVEPVMVRPAPMRAVAPATATLTAAARTGRIGVRLAEGVAGAAVLAVALEAARPAAAGPFAQEPGPFVQDSGAFDQEPGLFGRESGVYPAEVDRPGGAFHLGAGRDRGAPIPVYSATFAPLDTGEEAYASRLADDRTTHRTVTAGPDQFERDLDAFLADLGEPVPDPTGYLVWATARSAAGEVDALLDPAGANLLLMAGDRMPANAHRHAATAYLARVADRCAARFGVAVRTPYVEAVGSGDILRRELARLTRAAELTGADQLRHPAPTRELLTASRGRIYATLLSERFASRPWADQRAALAGFGALLAGRRNDAEYFWRLYLVERWLRLLEAPTAAPMPRGPLEPNPGHLLESGGWLRFPVRTPMIGAGDRIADNIRYHIAEFVGHLAADKYYRKVLGTPWFVVVAAKPVAVAQGRARYLWEIVPGLFARVLTARGDGVRRGPWRTQLAIEATGLGRVVCAGGLRVMGLRTLAYKVGGPALRAVAVPREDAVFPADVAVIAPPDDPDAVAAALLGALRTGLPADAYATLGGCAIVSGARVLGWAGTGEFPAEALGDDPLGSARELTPLALVTLPPTTRPTKKDKTRRGVPSGARR
ncbi:hypothetical protein Lfu02_27720 [Longispora fulva]|uniref:Uncharacterized protein n=1 Tax=Longispora fulva TaxID=619741 RepID=A0A8J7GL49_9ACTN|nr:hypothetical protein [Longispora fulva]MBG6138907.1 hypothetical protein [Longispora fulva]GIG58400.1 hypothetical protein Lfu02_27720 [Longispora fulva]